MNSVLIRNVYNTNFSGVTAFLSSTVKLANWSIDLILFKAIGIELELAPGEEKDFSFKKKAFSGNIKPVILNILDKNVDETFKKHFYYSAKQTNLFQFWQAKNF